MEYLVFNSACELVMLEFKAWFISFCTCFYFNTDSIQDQLLLHGSFLPSWKSGLILSRETFLKFTFVTLQPLKIQNTLAAPLGCGGFFKIYGFLSCVTALTHIFDFRTSVWSWTCSAKSCLYKTRCSPAPGKRCQMGWIRGEMDMNLEEETWKELRERRVRHETEHGKWC